MCRCRRSGTRWWLLLRPWPRQRPSRLTRSRWPPTGAPPAGPLPPSSWCRGVNLGVPQVRPPGWRSLPRGHTTVGRRSGVAPRSWCGSSAGREPLGRGPSNRLWSSGDGWVSLRPGLGAAHPPAGRPLCPAYGPPGSPGAYGRWAGLPPPSGRVPGSTWCSQSPPGPRHAALCRPAPGGTSKPPAARPPPRTRRPLSRSHLPPLWAVSRWGLSSYRSYDGGGRYEGAPSCAAQSSGPRSGATGRRSRRGVAGRYPLSPRPPSPSGVSRPEPTGRGRAPASSHRRSAHLPARCRCPSGDDVSCLLGPPFRLLDGGAAAERRCIVGVHEDLGARDGLQVGNQVGWPQGV